MGRCIVGSKQAESRPAMRDKKVFDGVSEQEVRSELARILQSPLFTQSDRLARFLRFTVEAALAGESDSLKEYVIGTEVYDRKPPYQPSQDSIVRTEARRLRKKLKEYYESEGENNPLFIYFRPGSYAPVFHRNERKFSPRPPLSTSESNLIVQGAGVSVAVLPFVDLSSRQLSTLCAQAIGDELSHALARTDGINVASRASVSRFTADSNDVPAFAERLGLQAILEGTVREENNRLRITINVLNSEGFQTSSHRFETEAGVASLSQVQEQIATALISRVRPQQSYIRRGKAGAGALMLAVYPVVVHAETLLDEGSASDLNGALTKFQDAAEMAPDYARSHCGISLCYTEMALRGAIGSSETIPRARAAATRAVELDPEMFGCYCSLASAQALEWEWFRAEESFARALRLGLHTVTSRLYSLFCAARGRFDEGLHHMEMAQRVDPFSYRQKVARAKFFHLTRRYEEGVGQLLGPLLYGPQPLEARLCGAVMLAHLGKTEEAKQTADSLRADAGAQPAMMAGIAEVLALSGEMDAARKIATDFHLLASSPPISGFRQALLALALGEAESAVQFLTAAAKAREAELVWIDVDPRFDSAREHPAFAGVVQQVFRGDGRA